MLERILDYATQIGFFIYYETAFVSVFGKKAMKFFKWFYLIPGVINR